MRNFARAAAVACLLGFGLAGCTSVDNLYTKLTGVSVPEKYVGAAEESFDGLEATGTNYIRACVSHSKVCVSRAIVPAIATAMRDGRAARNGLVAFQKSNPGTLGPSGLYNALVSASQTLSNLFNQNGIKASS